MSVTSLHAANADLVGRARAELKRFLAKGPTAAEVDAYFTALIAEYGAAAGAVAAEYYNTLRAERPLRQDFQAVVVLAPPADELRTAIRWALQPDTDTVARLDLKASTLILRPGRDTIIESIAADPAGPAYVRQPHGDACAFCLMLAAASTARYKTAQSAIRVVSRRAAREVGDKYHDNCGCTPEPVWPGDALPYDPSNYESMYTDATKAVGSKDTSAILAHMRLAHGLR